MQQETITLSQAKELIKAMAHQQSLLLLSPPGVGKSATVAQAATEAGLLCRSLLGTQIAPEDVSGIPRIVGERSVFCPPRILLPEHPEPFCLFLDELPACAPDIQKAFYSLLLERRIGEHQLPEGTWVVAAGNRTEDRALVRTMSSALINRTIILNIRVDVKEWLVWAKANGIRKEIIAFITFMPDALMRPIPAQPVPFSTPRAWASLSQALDLAEANQVIKPPIPQDSQIKYDSFADLSDRWTNGYVEDKSLQIDAKVKQSNQIRRALAFGRLTAADASLFCAMAEEEIAILPPLVYLKDPTKLPETNTALWFVLHQLRTIVEQHKIVANEDGIIVANPDSDYVVSPGLRVTRSNIDRFLTQVPQEHRFALLVGLVPEWSELGADKSMLRSLEEVTGMEVYA